MATEHVPLVQVMFLFNPPFIGDFPAMELMTPEAQRVSVLGADPMSEAVGESPAELLAAHQLLEFDEKATSYPSARWGHLGVPGRFDGYVLEKIRQER